jgi:MerR family copper efflux transcriptional regulator
MTRYRVSELARLCGVNPRTVDFYTGQGLLAPVERSEGGHRFYGEDAPERVRVIKALQAEGLSLQQVQAQLASPDAALSVLAHAEKLREELVRIEKEVMALGQEVANLPPQSEARGAAEHALQASMLCALGLAQKVASLLSDAHIPFV